MKKRLLLLACCIVGMLACSAFIKTGAVYAVDTDNFYFSDFTADYYLSKDEKGISHLRVVEELTAEFPEYNQNKGIRREIPFLNQGGTNVTLPELSESKITVLRNGEPEPIWSIKRHSDYYAVETGTDDYVTGTQVYTLEYEFEKVITDFGGYQELYWDTNGTGWRQRFASVIARLHFDDDIYDSFTGDSWCYTGAYGENLSKCQITKTYDGVEFTAKNLGPYENLTFDVEIKAGTFVIPGPEISYAAVIMTIIISGICLGVLIYATRKYQKASQKIKEYKGIFTAPEYQPHPDYDLAEITEVYLGKKRDVKVGILLDLIVNKKVELHKKGDKGIDINGRWALVVKDANLEREGRIILELLNGGNPVQKGDVIALKQRTATQKLIDLGEDFDKGVLLKVKQDELVDEKYRIGNAKSLNVAGVAILSVFWSMFVVFVAFALFGDFLMGLMNISGQVLVWKEGASITSFIIITLTVAVLAWMSERKTIIGSFTSKGLKASKYMEGLRLYIEMAEADRMKMLQSVEGADTSPESIVKLYEKLLPYAAVFGLEESWMDEMKEFCNAQEIDEPDYLLTGITASQLSRTMRTSAGYASGAGHTIAGGGSFSSSSSGGGGGGFSGGGGGGGGGGGR